MALAVEAQAGIERTEKEVEGAEGACETFLEGALVAATEKEKEDLEERWYARASTSFQVRDVSNYYGGSQRLRYLCSRSRRRC